MILGCRDEEGLHALVGGELNDFEIFLGRRDRQGLHALVAEELNNFK
jgi:hypothetical protein